MLDQDDAVEANEIHDIQPWPLALDYQSLDSNIADLHQENLLDSHQAFAKEQHERFKALAMQWGARFQDCLCFRRTFQKSSYNYSDISSNYGSLSRFNMDQNAGKVPIDRERIG